MIKIRSISVLLLLLFLSAGFTGCDRQYFSDEAAYKAQKDIYFATRKYYKKHKEAPIDIDILIEEGFLVIKDSVRKEWRFIINWPDEIIAISTLRNPGGEGRELVYEVPEVL
jgi:hypothetical protein